jgi:hypothetical protein
VLVGNWGSKQVTWAGLGFGVQLVKRGCQVNQYSRARKETVDQPKLIKIRITLGLKIEDNVGKLRAVNTLGTVV